MATKTVHFVKSWSMFYEDILSGQRTSDIRLNDRRYAVGDYMQLREYDPVKGSYTGREQTVLITYLQQNKSNPCAISREALKEGYVVLSIQVAEIEQPQVQVKLERDALRYEGLMARHLHKIAPILGVSFGSYTPDSDTKALVDSALDTQLGLTGVPK